MTIKQMISLGRQVDPLKIGYNQNRRWSFLDKKNRKLVPNQDTDCSALAAGIAWLAGYPINISGTCWTGNLDVLLKNAGWKIYKYTNKNAVKDGDVVLAKRAHAVTVLSKTEWLSAEKNELGKASGGRPGDQTGYEVRIRAPYERSGGWDYILRPPADPNDPVPPKPTKKAVKFRTASWNVKKSSKKTDHEADAKFIKNNLRSSVMLLQEVTEQNRTVIRQRMGLRRFLTWPSGYVAVVFDSKKYNHGGYKELPLGSIYHRAVKTPLRSKINNDTFVACSVHIRSNAVLPKNYTSDEQVKAKLDDVRKVIDFLKDDKNVVVGGDWSTKHARKVMEDAGYTLVTPWANTYKGNSTVSPLDAVYIRGPLMDVRNLYGDKGPGELHKSGATSDHNGVVGNITLK